MHSNIYNEDRNIIKILQKRKDIVIKPVDKDGAIVVWIYMSMKLYAKSLSPISAVM